MLSTWWWKIWILIWIQLMWTVHCVFCGSPVRSPVLRSPRHGGTPRRQLITPIPGNQFLVWTGMSYSILFYSISWVNHSFFSVVQCPQTDPWMKLYNQKTQTLPCTSHFISWNECLTVYTHTYATNILLLIFNPHTHNPSHSKTLVTVHYHHFLITIPMQFSSL